MLTNYPAFAHNTGVHGGTEYMARTFMERIYPNLNKLNEYICLVAPGVLPPLDLLIKDKRKIIMWVHNAPTQFNPIFYKTLENKVLMDKVEYIVVPSIAAKNMYLRDIPWISPDKIYVINNAIVFCEYEPNKFKDTSAVRVIHTSDPSRGMPTLVDSVERIKADIRVDVYNEFNPDLHPGLVADPRIRFYGRTPRATVREAMGEAHIYAYPSNFEETFCLSIVEAMSAGALPIYSKIGSLEEVTNGFGISYDYEPDADKHLAVFTDKFNEGIDLVKSGKWDPSEQVKYVLDTYSWKSIERQWKAFEGIL